MRPVFFSLIASLNFFSAPAQQLTPVYFSPAIDNGNVGGLYESVPAGYGSNNNSYPLIVFVHGLGQVGSGDSTDLPLIWNYTYSLPSYIHDGLFPSSFTVGGRSFSFIVIMPQFKSWPVGGDVEQIINWAKAHFRVDPTRIYVTGFSMGGQSVWSYASTPAYAHQSAAIVPIAGDLAPTVSQAYNIAGANLPVWAFHNDSDNVVPLSYSVGWVSDINNHVPAPIPPARLTIFRATGHEGWTTAYNPAYTENGMNIYQWMLSYSTAGYSVNNPPPVARAPNDTITLPANTLSLDASGSTDSGGTIVQFRWSGISGPVGYSMSDSTAIRPVLGNLVAGTYQFLLTVTDNYGLSGTDTVAVLVNPAPYPLGCKSAFPIVVMGSSTAFGHGATPIDSAWAYKYLDYLRKINLSYTITNIAVSGYGSFQECPTGFPTPGGMPQPDTAHNITRAIALRPSAIILNLPSNDAASGYPLTTQETNFNAIAAAAAAAGIPLWVTTTQPRDKMSPSQVALLTGMRDWIYSRFAGKSIDFWDTLANANGSINPVYNYDGIHVNNAGHQILFQRVVAADIPDSLCLRSTQGGFPPIAHAGADQMITLPADSAVLDGSASTDSGGTIVAYGWRQVSGPGSSTLSSVSAVRITVSHLLAGVYQFELQVTASQGQVSRDTVSVSVVAQQGFLKASAGTNITLTLPLDSTVLNGSRSSDSGSVIGFWQWSEVSGPSEFGLVAGDSPVARLTNLVAGQYTFMLLIRDQKGDSASAEVMVMVNPQAATGSDTQRVLIDVGGDGKTGGAPTPSPDWQGKYWNNMTNASGGVAVSGMVDTKNNPTGLSLVVLKRLDAGAGTYGPGMNFSGPTQIVGDYPVTAVQDNAYATNTVSGGSWELEGLDSTRTYQVKFWGSRMTSDLNRILMVKKAGDSAWQQYNGANNTDPNQAAVIGGIHGVSSVVFQMQVGARSTFGHISVVDITILNPHNPPVANAGTDQTITLPLDSATLNGSGSSEAGGTIASFHWREISGPSLSFPDSGVENPLLANLVAGTYQFVLTVTDNQGATSGPDTTSLLVQPAPLLSPVAIAGPDTTIALPLDSVRLTGRGSFAPSGHIVSYLWQKVFGTSQYRFSDSAAASPLVSNLAVGVYLFTLTVTDNNGLTGSDSVVVVVNGASPPPSPDPVAIAGPDTTLFLPLDSVFLSGTGSTDANGKISSWQWNQISGPGTAMIGTPQSSTTVAGNLLAGTYTFSLTVTDTSGINSSPDTVTIQVNPHIPPRADAGGSRGITLPLNSLTLDGTGSTDSDGTITGWLWRAQGPAGFLFSDSLVAVTTLSDLVAGTYRVSLQVTDNAGSSGSDTITVTVNTAPPPPPPIANAGPDQTITLPEDSATLNGSGSSGNGSPVIAYLWKEISGPPGALILQADSAATGVTGLVAGDYLFTLQVTGSGGPSTDTVAISVNSPLPPVAQAGKDTAITLPANTILLNGSGSLAPSGTIVSYQWSEWSGPITRSFGDSLSATTPVTGLEQGLYLFKLVVRDNLGDTASALVADTVYQEPVLNDTQRVLIDVGGDGKTGGAPTPSPDWQGKYWNNMTNASGGVAVSGMVDTKNNPTGLTLVVLKRLDAGAATYGPGMNFSGPTQIVGDYPVTAVQDNAYATNTVSGGSWELEGLDSTRTYQVKFWGSWMTSDLYRILMVKKAGDSAWQQYNGSNNTDPNQAAVIGGIHGVSSVVFQMQVGARSTFGHISVVDIRSVTGTFSFSSSSGSASGEVLGSELAPQKGSVLIAPNPANSEFHILINDPYRGRLGIRLVSINGQVLRRQQMDKHTDFLDILQQSSGLPNGLYLIQIQEQDASVTLKFLKN